MARRRGGSLISDGFQFTLGSLAAVAVYILVGLIFIIPGMFLILKEKKKQASQRNKTMIIIGMVLVGLGSVIALGLGFGMLATGMETLLE